MPEIKKERNSQRPVVLSHRFGRPGIKSVALFASLIFNVVLVIMLVRAIGVYKEPGTGIFLIIVFLLNVMYDHFLFRSKMIKYDDQYLYIGKGKKEQKLLLDHVLKINRVFFFFYRIRYKTDTGEHKDVYFFFSPNPAFREDKKIKAFKAQLKS